MERIADHGLRIIYILVAIEALHVMSRFIILGYEIMLRITNKKLSLIFLLSAK